MPRPIVFFGSSFNPPTKAHLALVRYMLELSKNDVPRPIIVLAPVYKHMFSKPDLVDFEPRLHLTQTQFRQEIADGNVLVSDIEGVVYRSMQQQQVAPGQDPSTVKVRCGTVDILQYIKDHPGIIPDGDVNHISLILGGDTYNDFLSGKWKNAEHIMQLCDAIHVFGRDGVMPNLPPILTANARQDADDARNIALDRIQAVLPNTAFIFHADAITDPSIQGISSTKIRNDIQHAVTGVVADVLALMRERYHDLFKSTREEREKNSSATSSALLQGKRQDSSSTDGEPSAKRPRNNNLAGKGL